MTDSTAATPAAIQGFVLQATYRVQHGVPVVYIFGRLASGDAFVIRDNRQRPHFFVPRTSLSDPALSRLRGVNVTEVEKRSFAGELLAKVEVGIPSDAPAVRDALHGAQIPTYEADVRFAMRYLIDRGIKCGLEIVPTTEPQQPREGYWVFDNPEVLPADSTPQPRVLSFDIETEGRSDKLLAISCYGLGVDEVVVVDRRGREMPANALGVPTEKDALHYFAELIHKLDVDVLTGWNVIDFDLSVLQKVADRVRYDFTLGREQGRMRIRPAEGYFGSGSATIPGRLVLDGMDLVRGAFVRMDDYSLDGIATAVLGEGKTLGQTQAEDLAHLDKVGQILHTYAHDLPRFCEYARTDARLALEIVEELDLIQLAFARSKLTGMTADRVAASIASFDFLYLSALQPMGLAAPSVAQPGNMERVAQGGGAVFEPEAGIHSNVWVCDFKSLYPSIIRTFNIDPLGYVLAEQGADAIRTVDDTAFAAQAGILPAMLDTLFPQRAEAKARGDGVASQAIKILMNSFYGVLGTPACRFYNPHIANAITSQGRYFLSWSRDWFAARGYEVLYGDTDSVFVASGLDDSEAAHSQIGDIINAFNTDIATHIRERFGVESQLEMEYEKLYAKLFLARTRGGSQGARKRYAGLRHGAEEVEFVGMEVVRRDWTDLAKNAQKNLITRLFQGEDVSAYLEQTVKALRAGELDDQLVYRKGLRKAVDTYTTNVPPHVQAVKKAQAGQKAGEPPPRVVRYVITDQGPELVDERRGKLDLEHYLERQLKPVAEPILDVMNLEFAKVIGDDRQTSLF